MNGPRRLGTVVAGAIICLHLGFAAQAQEDARPSGAAFAPLVSREEAVVVSVRVDDAEDESDQDDWLGTLEPFEFQRGVQPPSRRMRRSLASGFIVSAEGDVLTNAHAVRGATRLWVRLIDGREVVATIVGVDARTDIALLHIQAPRLVAARAGDPSRLQVGDWVFTIGAPFGLERSVTAGIVSAKRRYMPDGPGVPLIQTDVAINPGSSGSPLFDLRGEVVGVNSMMLSGGGGYDGVSLALPIDVALQVVRELRSRGHVRRSTLGAKVQEVTPQLARSFGLAEIAGALVLSVEHGGPAERAGLRTGDIVLGPDGAADRSYGALMQAVAAAPPRSTLPLDVWRGGTLVRLSVEPTALEPDRVPAATARPAQSRLGLRLAEVTAESRRALRIAGAGVVVRQAAGAAHGAGIREGDVILAVNDAIVSDLRSFDAALAKGLAARGAVALLVQRDGAVAYIAVEAD